MLQGLGFFIWQLGKMPPPLELKAFCVHYGVKWLSFKLLDADTQFGDMKLFRQYVDVLNGTVRLGMWQYCYGVRPGPEGAAVGAMFQKFPELSFHCIDAEGDDWNEPYGMKKKAELYLASLDINRSKEVYLNSYRYPEYFPNFPFAPFMNNERVTGTMPQVYWQEAHDPHEQVRESFRQYCAISPKPYVPLGSMYSVGEWSPTYEDYKLFAGEVTVLGLPASGYYSLDWVMQYEKWDWMEAATGRPPLDTPEPTTPTVAEVTVLAPGYLNVRLGPDSTIVGRLWSPARVRVVGNLKLVGTRKWAQIGENLWCCFSDGPITYMKWVTL